MVNGPPSARLLEDPLSSNPEVTPPSKARLGGGGEPVRPAKRRSLLPVRRERTPGPTAATYGATPLIHGYRRDRVSPAWKVVLYALLAVTCVGWGFYFGLSAPFRIMPLIAPLPLLMLLIIWALPQGEYAPRRAIEPLHLGFFVSLMLWPNYIAITLPGMPWLTMLRIFVVPLIIVTLICISVSPTFRKTMKDCLTSDPFIWRMFAAFVFLQTVTLPLSDRPVLTLNRYIVDQLNHTSIFLISCYVFLLPGFAQRWSKAVLCAAYFICGIGLWENQLGSVPWSGHIPPFLNVESEFVEGVLGGASRSSVGIHRVGAMSAHPLAMAELLGLVAPFALHIGMTRNPLILRILGFAYIPLALMLIELADSRMGNVAMLSAILFYVLIWATLRWRSHKQSLIAPALVLLYPAILGSALLGTFFVGRLRNAVWGGGAKAGSTEARSLQWDLAIPKVITHPFGHGLGQAARKVGYVNPAGKGSLDSYYINMLMDFGPLGFLLFFGMFLYAAWLAAKVVIYFRPSGDTTLLLPLMVAMLQFVIIKSVLGLDHNHPFVFMMLGAIVALAFRAKREQPVTDEDASTKPALAR